MIKMVVFDMAGTTVDEQNVVYKTLWTAVNKAGFDFSFEEVLLMGAGKEKKQAIVDILQNKSVSADRIESIFKDFLELLEEAYRDLEVLAQPGALELFEYLKNKGIKVVLNTGYNQETAEKLVQKLGWKQGVHFDLLVTASQVSQARPAPDMIWLAKEKLNIEDNTLIIKVGDSIIDIEEGKNAGCGLSIGITTGAHTRAQLLSAAPDVIIDKLLDLREMV